MAHRRLKPPLQRHFLFHITMRKEETLSVRAKSKTSTIGAIKIRLQWSSSSVPTMSRNHLPKPTRKPLLPNDKAVWLVAVPMIYKEDGTARRILRTRLIRRCLITTTMTSLSTRLPTKVTTTCSMEQEWAITSRTQQQQCFKIASSSSSSSSSWTVVISIKELCCNKSHRTCHSA